MYWHSFGENWSTGPAAVMSTKVGLFHAEHFRLFYGRALVLVDAVFNSHHRFFFYIRFKSVLIWMQLIVTLVQVVFVWSVRGQFTRVSYLLDSHFWVQEKYSWHIWQYFDADNSAVLGCKMDKCIGTGKKKTTREWALFYLFILLACRSESVGRDEACRTEKRERNYISSNIQWNFSRSLKRRWTQIT